MKKFNVGIYDFRVDGDELICPSLPGLKTADINDCVVDPNDRIDKKRRLEYPPMTDFADAYYHLQKGDNALMQEYLDKVEAVKLKYPKG